MVVSKEVEDPMDQEEREFPCNGMALLVSLSSRGLDRNDHVAQEIRLRRGGTLLLRKSQNVGGIIVVQIHPIESPDGSITDQEDRNLILRSAQGG